VELPAIVALTALGWLCAGLASIGVAYTLAAGLLAARFVSRRARAANTFPPVSIVKPLHGAHPGLAGALERFCDQDYPGDVQILFGVQDAKDPAIAVVERLKAQRPDVDIQLVVDPRLYGTNRKASNLINIAARARHGLLILSDADILVEPDYLRRVVAAMSAPGVGAVSCLYVGGAGRGLWARLAAMAIDYHFLPGAVVGKALGLAQPCFGSTIAISTAVLAEIGGFAAFADHLADDYEIGRAVRARGYRIAIPPMIVSHYCGEESGAELLGHELRWGRTVRQIDPAGYAGSLITYPTPLAILAALFTGLPAWSLALLAVALAARLLLKVLVDAATGGRAGPWWLIPVRDVLSFGVFLASFVVNTIGWQGRRFRVGPDGVLLHS
jgi:ceramide glucosyltransferase